MASAPHSSSGSFLVALAWMTGALFSFLTMGVAGRELSVELEPQHIAFYRSTLCVLILAPLVWRAGWDVISTRHPGRHVVRNSIHFVGTWCWLYGVAALPLAEVFTIEFTAPIWTALLASLFLGERLTRSRVLAIALGFTGILVLLRPGLSLFDPASVVVLGAALGYAITYVITKNLTATDSALTIIWWMNVVQLPIGGALSLPDLPLPSVALWPWTVAVGVVGLTSHYCLSRAMRVADATVVAPLDFLRLPLAAVVAWVLYAEALDPFVLVAAAFIVAGNWVNLKRG